MLAISWRNLILWDQFILLRFHTIVKSHHMLSFVSDLQKINYFAHCPRPLVQCLEFMNFHISQVCYKVQKRHCIGGCWAPTSPTTKLCFTFSMVHFNQWICLPKFFFRTQEHFYGMLQKYCPNLYLQQIFCHIITSAGHSLILNFYSLLKFLFLLLIMKCLLGLE